MPRLDPDATAGLVPRLAAMSTPEFSVVARWATPQGMSALGNELDARVAQAVRAFADRQGVAWTPGVDIAAGGVERTCKQPTVPAPGAATLTIDCSIVLAAGSVLGERLVTIDRVGGRPRDIRRTVLYADTATGELGDGTGLFEPGTEARVMDLLAEGLRAGGRAAAGSSPLDVLTPEGRRALLADAVLTASDDLVVAVPLAPSAAGTGVHTVPVVVPARLLAPFFSAFGARVRDAAVSADVPIRAEAPTAADPVDCTFVACVSITFDDGPSSLTAGLLEILHERRAPATFYVQGLSVERRPGVALQTAEAGHEIGNHTWAHSSLPLLPDDQVRAEIERAQAAIRAASGIEARSLRPPYGAFDDRVRALIGLPFVVWDVDTNDWRSPGSDVVTSRAVEGAERGSIILLHDTHEETVAAVPGIVDGLRARGFTLATVSDQFAGTLPPPGSIVSHGPG